VTVPLTGTVTVNGPLRDTAVLVVAATDRELALVRDADTFCCGIGPVEAALQTARALAEHRPGAVLHIGIAGARGLEPPALVIGTESVYCDVVDPSSTLPRVERIVPDASLLERVRHALPDARLLPIATSGRVGGGTACDVEAMEGFGVLRAAAHAGVAAVEVRAVSNELGEEDRSRWDVDGALAGLGTALPALLTALDAAARTG